jgi:hypothetical protein
MLLRSTSKYYEVLFYQKHFIRNKLDRPQLFAQKEERSTPTQYVARMLNLMGKSILVFCIRSHRCCSCITYFSYCTYCSYHFNVDILSHVTRHDWLSSRFASCAAVNTPLLLRLTRTRLDIWIVEASRWRKAFNSA